MLNDQQNEVHDFTNRISRMLHDMLCNRFNTDGEFIFFLEYFKKLQEHQRIAFKVFNYPRIVIQRLSVDLTLFRKEIKYNLLYVIPHFLCNFRHTTPP